MFRSACLAAFMTLLAGFTSGQPSDSLQSAFNSQTGTEQIETGLQLCQELRKYPERMLRISFLLLEKTHKTEVEPILSAKVLKAISDAYFANDSIERSIEYLKNTINLVENLSPADSDLLGKSYYDLGLNLMDLEKNSEATIYLNLAAGIYEKLKRFSDLSDTKSDLATAYFALGKLENAIALYTEVYQLDLKTGNKRGQSSSLNNLGRMYVEWKKYELGLEYYKKSLELLDTIKDRTILSIRYNNIGMVYQLMGNHAEAIKWIQKALNIDIEENNPLKLGIRYSNLGNSYLALKDYDKAMDYFLQAEKYLQKTSMYSYLSKIYLNIGNLYSSTKNRAKSEEYFHKAVETAEKGSTLPEMSIAYSSLYKLYKQTGDTGQALVYYEKHKQATDSIYSLEARKKIEELEAQYETQKKEARIQKLDTENEIRKKELKFRKRERNWALAGITLLVGFLIGLFFLYSTVKKQKQTLARQNLQLDQMNHMQNKLFGIISHDLRNVAAAYQASSKIIQYYLRKGQPEKLMPVADEIGKNAQNLSSMLENLLGWAVIQMKGLNPEYKTITVKDEFSFQAQLFEEMFSLKSDRIEIISGDETVWCDPESFRLILRNLLANAAKFTSDGTITLKSWKENENTFIEIRDTGCGMPPEIASDLFDFRNTQIRTGTNGERGTGLGLQLVYEHTTKNNGSIKVASEEDKGTSFILTLPNKAL